DIDVPESGNDLADRRADEILAGRQAEHAVAAAIVSRPGPDRRFDELPMAADELRARNADSGALKRIAELVDDAAGDGAGAGQPDADTLARTAGIDAHALARFRQPLLAVRERDVAGVIRDDRVFTRFELGELVASILVARRQAIQPKRFDRREPQL